jgi:hypothetical protein
MAVSLDLSPRNRRRCGREPQRGRGILARELDRRPSRARESGPGSGSGLGVRLRAWSVKMHFVPLLMN